MSGIATVGVELEWADIDRHAAIPEHLGHWSTEDYSIVNSDGHANCPTGTTWRWGGEVNTMPTETPQGQAEITRQLLQVLNSPPPVINWKCNLHVHVRPAEFVELMKPENLPWLKRVATRMREAESIVYSHVERVPIPTHDQHPGSEEYAGAMRRYRRRLTSHQYRLPEARWLELLAADTHAQFRDAHAPPTKTGNRAWHLAPRPGMNFRSLWKHGTIEFRHFPGTADPLEVLDSARWCMEFVALMTPDSLPVLDTDPTISIGSQRARSLYMSRRWRFPEFRTYNHDQWLRFEVTKHK